MLFYVYVLKLRPSGKVFYVGKGSRDRMFHHRRIIERPYLKENQRGVYKRFRVVLGNSHFTEEKVFETEDETEALLHEQSLIQHYGFDNLINTQSHAFTGRKLKPEVGRLISERLTGRKLPLSVRQKIGAAHKGKKWPASRGDLIWKTRRQNGRGSMPEEGRQKLHRANIGKTLPASVRISISRSNMGKKMSAECVRKRARTKRSNPKRYPGAKSRYKGVSWLAPNRAWQARLCVNYMTILLGQFKHEIDAAAVYDANYEKLFGMRPNKTDRNHRITRFYVGLHGKLIERSRLPLSVFVK